MYKLRGTRAASTTEPCRAARIRRLGEGPRAETACTLLTMATYGAELVIIPGPRREAAHAAEAVNAGEMHGDRPPSTGESGEQKGRFWFRQMSVCRPRTGGLDRGGVGAVVINRGGGVMTTYDYDVLVVGAGQGGLPAAHMAANLGAKVALIEREEVGGT